MPIHWQFCQAASAAPEPHLAQCNHSELEGPPRAAHGAPICRRHHHRFGTSRGIGAASTLRCNGRARYASSMRNQSGHFLVTDNDPPKQWRRRGEPPANACGAQPVYIRQAGLTLRDASWLRMRQRSCLGARSGPEKCRIARPSPRTRRVHVGAASGDSETSRFYLMSLRLRGGFTLACNTSLCRSESRVTRHVDTQLSWQRRAELSPPGLSR